MGRIKSLLVKRTAKKLLNEEASFNGDFEHNKRMLGNSMPSKKMRNKIAGYIGRMVRIREKAALRPVKKIELESTE